jgi:trehalose-phosphatase
MSWKNDVLEIFTYYTERTQGSFVEHKRSSITWHYRQADPEYGYSIINLSCLIKNQHW